MMQRRLPVDPGATRQARQAVGELGSSVPAGVLADAQLLASELITNCIRHAGLGVADRIELRVLPLAGRVRVEVFDEGTGFSASPRPAGAPWETGWGLYLVDRIADRWDVNTDEGTVVWFEIDYPTTDPDERTGPSQSTPVHVDRRQSDSA